MSEVYIEDIDEEELEEGYEIFAQCPECKEYTMTAQEGCYLCQNCGYSLCAI